MKRHPIYALLAEEVERESKWLEEHTEDISLPPDNTKYRDCFFEAEETVAARFASGKAKWEVGSVAGLFKKILDDQMDDPGRERTPVKTFGERIAEEFSKPPAEADFAEISS